MVTLISSVDIRIASQQLVYCFRNLVVLAPRHRQLCTAVLLQSFVEFWADYFIKHGCAVWTKRDRIPFSVWTLINYVRGVPSSCSPSTPRTGLLRYSFR